MDRVRVICNNRDEYVDKVTDLILGLSEVEPRLHVRIDAEFNTSNIFNKHDWPLDHYRISQRLEGANCLYKVGNTYTRRYPEGVFEVSMELNMRTLTEVLG